MKISFLIFKFIQQLNTVTLYCKKTITGYRNLVWSNTENNSLNENKTKNGTLKSGRAHERA
jgi:hypothetical protein